MAAQITRFGSSMGSQAKDCWLKSPTDADAPLWQLTMNPQEEDRPDLHATHQAQTELNRYVKQPGFGESVMARLNLFTGAWPAPNRVAFLAEFDPQVISGSPASLSALLDILQGGPL